MTWMIADTAQDHVDLLVVDIEKKEKKRKRKTMKRNSFAFLLKNVISQRLLPLFIKKKSISVELFSFLFSN